MAKKEAAKSKKPETKQLEVKAPGGVDAVLSEINKAFGKGSAVRMGDKASVPVSVISTGALSVDFALGVGGFARGRVVEVYGPESGGKTTLTLQAIAQAQRAGGQAGFIDAEHALDPIYAEALGVDVDNLVVSQPDNGEQALEIAEMMVKSGSFDIIVIDSVAALVPKAELEGSMGDPQMGLQARLMSQALRKLTPVVSKSKTCLIFINQIRMKIGVMFGNPETTTGGRALKFYASQRLDVRGSEKIMDGDVQIGARAKIKVVKNKLAAPFKFATIDMIFGRGFSPEVDAVRLGVEHELITKSGTWLSYAGESLGQGDMKAADFLRENPIVFAQLWSALREKLFAVTGE